MTYSKPTGWNFYKMWENLRKKNCFSKQEVKMANFNNIYTVVLFAAVFGCCYGAKKCAILNDINGCSTPIKSDQVPYRVLFTPACNSHDACYRCVSS